MKSFLDENGMILVFQVCTLAILLFVVFLTASIVGSKSDLCDAIGMQVYGETLTWLECFSL